MLPEVALAFGIVEIKVRDLLFSSEMNSFSTRLEHLAGKGIEAVGEFIILNGLNSLFS